MYVPIYMRANMYAHIGGLLTYIHNIIRKQACAPTFILSCQPAHIHLVAIAILHQSGPHFCMYACKRRI